MCGIVYIEDFLGRPVNNGILQQYDAQKHRGQEGFGLFDGQKMNIVKATKENKILKWLVKYNSSMLLFHHRFPTSTANVKRAAHPFSTRKFFGDNTYILVHNGVIRNADELFVEHQELGIDYHTLLEDLTFNDSEALLWDVALYLEGKQPEPKAIGDMAFICIKLVKNKPERMFFYRNTGRPLNFLRSSEGIMLSSEGDGDVTPIDTLYNWNYKLKRLYKRKLVIMERKPYAGTLNSGQYTPSTNFQRQSYPYSDPYYDDYDYDKYGYDQFGNWIGSGGRYDWEGNLRPVGAYTPGSYAASRDPADDPVAYDNWWEGKDARTAGNWLGEHLREKFDKFFNKDGSLKGAPELGVIDPAMGVIDRADKSQNTLEYEKSESGIYVPKKDRKISEKNLVARTGTYPTEEEVVTEMMAYLAGVKGHFEQAYWAIECDYEDLENKPQTKTVIRQKVLLDLVLQRLDNDPEYKNEESISNMWRSIWQQQQLVKS